MSRYESSVHINGKGLTHGLDDTTLTAENQYSISFIENNKKLLFELAL